MNMRKFCSGLASAALVSTAFSLTALAPAHADPSFTPDAGTDIVGTGSDTIEGVVTDLAGGMTVDGASIPGFNAAKTSGRLASWDATGPVGNGGAGSDPGKSYITPRSGAAEMVRPNGSGQGIATLMSTGGTAALNYARSSSALSAQQVNDSNALRQLPFAVDGLKMAVAKSGTYAPATLSDAQVVGIYNGQYTDWGQVGGTAGKAIKAYVPQSGSGTRNFFLAQLKARNNNTDVSLFGVASTQEHSPTDIERDPAAIVPFSTARSVYPASNSSAIALVNGFSLERAVYIVLRNADVATYASVFGPSGFVCSADGQKIVAAHGFRPIRNADAGGVCGEALTSAPNEAQLSAKIETRSSLAAAATGPNTVKLTATVTKAAEGVVEFYEGETKVGESAPDAGIATKTLTGVRAGTHTYVAKFVPDNLSAATASESTPVEVSVVDPTATTGAVTISPAATKYGQSRSATVKIVGDGVVVPTGNVTVKVNGVSLGTKALSSGAATFAIASTTTAGTKTVVASYVGDAKHAPSTKTVSVSIAKAGTVLSETYGATVRTTSARGVIRASIGSTVKPRGTVTIVRNGARVAAKPLVNGAISYTVPGLRKGRNTITLRLPATANTNAVTKTFLIIRK